MKITPNPEEVWEHGDINGNISTSLVMICGESKGPIIGFIECQIMCDQRHEDMLGVRCAVNPIYFIRRIKEAE